MNYMCLDCGYIWEIAKVKLRLGYRRCPRCRSYDTVPEGFFKMVETGKKLGISDKTPFLDLYDAFIAVWREKGILELGVREFWRVMRRVIREIEKPTIKMIGKGRWVKIEG